MDPQALLGLAVVAGVYALLLVLYPMVPCRWCKGGGKRRPGFGRAFGFCRHCGGNGRRLRVPVRLVRGVLGRGFGGAP